MSLYVGVNGSTKKVSKLLVGVNGSAKEVNTGYTGGGVNSNLNKVYSNFDIDKELQAVNPVAALTSGKITTADIGKTVYLSNNLIICQEWRIADINHDGTSGTVDLFSKYTLIKHYNAQYGSNKFYINSGIRIYLKDVATRFTSEIQNAMKVQSFPSNGNTLSDKVKCPSVTELGCTNPNYSNFIRDEGTIYPLFGMQSQYPNPLAIYSKPDGSGVENYWTRSCHTKADNYVWMINTDGYANTSDCTSSSYYNVIACIRF